MDRFDTMLAFTRVVELKSFTKAATSLNLPKATVSAQVIALEKRLRVKLLNRTTRHVSVTPDGAGYYERAVRLLGELEETEASVSHAAMSPKGRLRVDVPGSVGRRIIAPALDDFFARYPEIDLELGCTDRPVDLVHEGIDCVIRGGDIHDESLVARRLGDFRMLTYAAPSYLAKHGEPQNLEDLERHQMIAFASPKTGKVFPLIYEKNDVQTVVQGIQRISINDADSCAAAACSGIGLVQLPAFIAREYVDSGHLVAIMKDYPSELVPVWILYPPNRHLSTKVRAFAEWAAELFAKTGFG
ncbi:MAG TPA: LysR family transcriptional regulator [Oxalicibacterium sp.]|uniref:LysR substrate-binding domain-containing protein n=1 Tax=Oxalicibacterium sp. TaxID=2766525 RepID=UPI002C0D812D|nr:LysR family transcriptional regulator [Oxalicibacterium sp.]HWU97241.1 LysR family transcriptional regulator [Oxalicibacterium sp.]